MERYLVLDIETKFWNDEVEGGWNNIEGFGLAVAVTENQIGKPRWFSEEFADVLIERLRECEKVITFNGINFDYRVLKPYGLDPTELIPKSVDILDRMHKQLGFRVSLDSVAKATLGIGKSGDGKKAVEWFRNGDIKKVLEYCKNDVELTREIYEFAKSHGYVYYTTLSGKKGKCQLSTEIQLDQ